MIQARECKNTCGVHVRAGTQKAVNGYPSAVSRYIEDRIVNVGSVSKEELQRSSLVVSGDR